MPVGPPATNKILVVVLIIVLLVGGFFVANFELHIIHNGGNGTAQCVSYLRGDCINNATYDKTTGDLTVYGLGQLTQQTWNNVAFAYAPAVAQENSQNGPIGAVFQTSSDLSNNVMNSGQDITITFAAINASAPVDAQGENGIIWAAYTTTSGGTACSGPIASLSQCSFFALATVTLSS